MHRHCGTNNRIPWWTFMGPCKPEVRPGAREESASPAWLAVPAMNSRDTKKVYIWRLDTGCGPTLYRKCHSHNTPGKRHNNTWVEPLTGNCTTSSTRQREHVWQKCKIQKKWCIVTVAPTIEHHGGHSWTPVNQRWDQVPKIHFKKKTISKSCDYIDFPFFWQEHGNQLGNTVILSACIRGQCIDLINSFFFTIS